MLAKMLSRMVVRVVCNKKEIMMGGTAKVDGPHDPFISFGLFYVGQCMETLKFLSDESFHVSIGYFFEC